MKKLIFFLLPIILVGQTLFASTYAARQSKCIRIMSSEELTKEAELIVRAKVTRVDRATYQGLYDQLATLKVSEVIDGDTALKDKEIKVWAQTRVPCANDSYAVNDELLVFLVREITFYHTLNYQYGQFHMQNEQVMGWRDKDKGEVAKNYPDVATEIRTILVARTTSALTTSAAIVSTPR
ncbi:MAG TPA: hypothetical protein VFC63_18170 [Blastocatellia bacterium]|nr:hypothetical protein [Blastocatellia bacterium]